jgi:flagellar basal-body rod protein FlgF
MDKGLYIAMTGAKHNARAQAVHANNLANASTDGFFKDFVQARSMPVYYGDGHPTRAYALAENPKTDFSQGPIIETGRDLDFAVQDKGWIAVQTPEGGEAYVKSASMQVNALGQLVTSTGLQVLGNGGPIALPPNQKIEIGTDGTVTIRGAGQGPEVLAAVDRIKLVNPTDEELKKQDDGLVVSKNGDPLAPAAEVQVISGFVSGSNVNTVEALTEMLSLSRQYEMQVKMMKTMQETSQTSSKLMRIS